MLSFIGTILNFKPNASLSGQHDKKHGRMAYYFAAVFT
jgi:hypothetical protein